MSLQQEIVCVLDGNSDILLLTCSILIGKKTIGMTFIRSKYVSWSHTKPQIANAYEVRKKKLSKWPANGPAKGHSDSYAIDGALRINKESKSV